MLSYAFETLGCLRVEFKTDARNTASRAALLGIGATFEGVFRKHMLVREGERRDSAWYSITDDEWPAVRVHLAERLAASARSVGRSADWRTRRTRGRGARGGLLLVFERDLQLDPILDDLTVTYFRGRLHDLDRSDVAHGA